VLEALALEFDSEERAGESVVVPQSHQLIEFELRSEFNLQDPTSHREEPRYIDLLRDSRRLHMRNRNDDYKYR
jgi:hypothetical protein